jgi:hypothetical protein
MADVSPDTSVCCICYPTAAGAREIWQALCGQLGVKTCACLLQRTPHSLHERGIVHPALLACCAGMTRARAQARTHRSGGAAAVAAASQRPTKSRGRTTRAKGSSMPLAGLGTSGLVLQ